MPLTVVVAWMLMSGSLSAPPLKRIVPRLTSNLLPAND